jgi:diguanylate cyclase (GGDEF)-like protein/PAS domain S-box-containing protein
MRTAGVDAVLDVVVKAAADLTRATGAVVEIADGNEMVYQAVAGTLASYQGLRLRRAQSLSGLCVELDQPLRTLDAQKDPRTDKASCARLGVQSMVCVPLGGVLPGVLKVVSGEVNGFNDDDERILAVLGQAIAVRVEHERRKPGALLARTRSPEAAVPAPDPALCVATLDSMQEVVLVVDRAGTVLLANRAARELLGDRATRPFDVDARTSDMQQSIELARRPIVRALAGETVRQEEVAVRQSAMGDRWLSVSSCPVADRDGNVIGALSVARDVTELRRTRESLETAATRDELTGLFNRRGFHEHAELAMRLATRSERPVSLLYMDLNGMKAINDQLGHAAGDRALTEFASVLRASTRASDVVARLGGDEYVLLTVDCMTDEDVARLQERIQSEIQTRNAEPERAYRLSSSIGAIRYVPSGRSSRTIDELLKQADQAMYQAKQQRKLHGTQTIPKSSR